MYDFQEELMVGQLLGVLKRTSSFAKKKERNLFSEIITCCVELIRGTSKIGKEEMELNVYTRIRYAEL